MIRANRRALRTTKLMSRIDRSDPEPDAASKGWTAGSFIRVLAWIPSIVFGGIGIFLFIALVRIDHSQFLACLAFLIVYLICALALMSGVIFLPPVFSRLPWVKGFWMRLLFALGLWAVGATAIYFSVTPITDFACDRHVSPSAPGDPGAEIIAPARERPSVADPASVDRARDVSFPLDRSFIAEIEEVLAGLGAPAN